MPADRPPYSKLVFISYTDRQRTENVLQEILFEKRKEYGPTVHLAQWIYQRLKYAGLPVRTRRADEAIGGSGFSEHSISVAAPMIAILGEGAIEYHDLKMAQEKGIEILFAPIDDVSFEYSLSYPNAQIFDLRGSSYKHEETFQSLKANLVNRTYPPPSGGLWDPQGDWHLQFIRSRLAESGYTEFFAHYHYTNVFADIYNRAAKIAALRDLGQLQILSGIVAAVLQDDPQEAVRAEAALALAKFDSYEYDTYFYEIEKRMYGTIFPIYVRLAQQYRSYPNSIAKIITDLDEVFVNPPDLRIKASNAHDVTLSERIEHDVFISYARKDSEQLAIQLAQDLTKAGFLVWIDTVLEPGTEEWTSTVERAISDSHFMIVLISPASNASKWVKREIHQAEALKKEIIPIFALRCNKPLPLQGMQGLRGDPILSEDPQTVLELLVNHLGNRLAAG